jgi:DNA polymerase-3 subunit gamma/tau
MSQALYRKYRSRSLDEVVGQEHITSLLQRAIARGSISHAYLLTGPKGVGKTSIARIIAHEINGLTYADDSQHLDIIEIDAASNNGIEDVRDLRDRVYVAPSSAAKKVYIIDEVHMLSKQAFNALLKTLEEPPEHVVFILATTDADKLPATIISRVQRFNFRAIGVPDVVKHLETIATKESITISEEALELIARHGGGSFRDSIGLLDQLQHVSDTQIERSDVEQALGMTADSTLEQLIDSYRTGNLAALAQHIQLLENSGTQAAIVAHQIIRRLQETIADHPEDIAVLDELLNVASSAYPYVKLLSVLAMHVQPRDNTASQPTVSNNTSPETEENRETGGTKEKMPNAIASDKSSEPTSPTNDNKSNGSAKKEYKQPQDTKKSQPSAPPQSTSAFDWQLLLKEFKDEIALRSLLSKSTHVLTDTTLTIFAGNKFNANRLNGSKQLQKLNDALKKIGFEQISVDIKSTTAPPSDSQLANVAAIMGGGTEVELNQNA